MPKETLGKKSKDYQRSHIIVKPRMMKNKKFLGFKDAETCSWEDKV